MTMFSEMFPTFFLRSESFKAIRAGYAFIVVMFNSVMLRGSDFSIKLLAALTRRAGNAAFALQWVLLLWSCSCFSKLLSIVLTFFVALRRCTRPKCFLTSARWTWKYPLMLVSSMAFGHLFGSKHPITLFSWTGKYLQWVFF